MGKYTIKAGDTLSELLEKYGNGNTSVRALAAHNNIRDHNVINVGQVIEIPGYEGESGSASGSSSSANTGYQYKTPAYTPSPFTTSEETNNAYANLNGLTKPEAIDPSYEAAWKDAMDRINNREKFSYDLNGDALYQQYKDKYIQQGKMAMQDTMGQAATLTGGYGNSYAATAGNQAYQAHLNNLNDVIPELQQMAYDRYKQEGQDLLNQYSMAKDVYDTKYGEHRDDMSQYNTDRTYLQSVYDSLYGRDYTMWNDDRTFGYGQHRDAITDEQWAAAMDYQKDRDKVTDAQWQKTYDLQKKNNAVIGGGYGGGGGGSPYDNGGYDSDVVRQAQEFIGVPADGMWGADSAAKAKAAGYNSIAEVVKAMGNKTSEFKGGDWVAATAYLAERGISPTALSERAMDRTTWQRHRNSYLSTNQGGEEIANYSTYEEYLKSIVKYIAYLNE